jgi:rSAM/selenodomain-associated transferase 2
MQISIIIPTYNEAGHLGSLLKSLKSGAPAGVTEVIVSDGGSTDNTVCIAAKEGARVVISAAKGRAVQMHLGASIAKGGILYFVHADCTPPAGFVTDILMAVKNGYSLGRYRTRFDTCKGILKLNAWLTRFDFFFCMGGDQTLFITKKIYDQSGGFNPGMLIMEEYEFCERVRKYAAYKILPGKVLVSARKYIHNTWLQVQLANFKIMRMYRRGASQQAMVNAYRNALKPHPGLNPQQRLQQPENRVAGP